MAHDAVQLLDRAMMAPEAPARDCMSAAAPAALHLALCQDGQHSRDALSLQSGISSLTGATACPLVSWRPVTQMSADPFSACRWPSAPRRLCWVHLATAEDSAMQFEIHTSVKDRATGVKLGAVWQGTAWRCWGR